MEATAIIERAEATAIVARAQATASALAQGAGTTALPATPPPSTAAAYPAPAASVSPTPSFTVVAGPAATSSRPQVEVLGVTLAGEGGFIEVVFTAMPQISAQWVAGTVRVIDEETGAVYDELVTLPSVGLLFARPNRPGQPGYVMLTNVNHGVHPGSIVTVVLGGYRKEHVVVH